MFKQRLATGLILAPLVLALVIWAPVWMFSLLMALVVLYGAWEWSDFCRFKASQRAAYVGTMAVLILLLQWSLSPVLINLVLLAAVVFWLMALVLVLRYPAQLDWRHAPVKALIGVLVLLPTWLALSEIKAMDSGEALILLLLFLVWGADTGAYAAGKTLGRHKLIPQVSPGKTMEGFMGGLLVCVLVGLIYALVRELDAPGMVFMVLLSLLTGVASVLGDLFESMLKRERGVKDSGTLLPGHGGVLDRIDSLTAAAPVFLFGLALAPSL